LSYQKKIDDVLLPAGFGEIFEPNEVRINGREIGIELAIIPSPDLGAIVTDVKNIHEFTAQLDGGDSPHRLALDLKFQKDILASIFQESQQDFLMLLLALHKASKLEIELDDLSQFPLFKKETGGPAVNEILKNSTQEIRDFVFYLKDNIHDIQRISLQIRNISLDVEIRNVEILDFVPTRNEYIASLRK